MFATPLFLIYGVIIMNMGEWLNIIRFEPLTTFLKGITFLGNSEFLYFFLPILYWCWRKRATAYLIALAILAVYLNFLLKSFFAWERPPADIWLIETTGYSFPSTHAVISVVVWGYLAYEVKRRWFTILGISLIVLISLSRIYLGVHYPQDVLAGMAVGAVFLHVYRWMVNVSKPVVARIYDIIKGIVVLVLSITMLFIQMNQAIATGAGLFAGVGVGFLMEPHFADFDPGDRWFKNIIKAALGSLILLAIWQGLEWVLPNDAGFKWFQFFILGLWVIMGAPWLFIQLRLAKREA